MTQAGRVANGVIALEVDPSDTVGEVKAMIHERGGLSPERQQLSFVGETLEDDRKLSSYKMIGSNCLLEEISMWITVRIQSSKSILLSVDSEETVCSIKARIKEKGGVPSSKEIILYENYKKLEDGKTLKESEIISHSRLYLRVLSSPGFVKLLVQSETGETATLNVEPNDTVEDLKYCIYDKMKIFQPNQQRLLIRERWVDLNCWKVMKNHKTLSSYEIIHDPSATYVVKLCDDSLQISIKIGTEEITLHVLATDSVKKVKEKIQEKEKIPVDEQLLMHANKIMENEQTLSHYNIRRADNRNKVYLYRKYITVEVKTSPNESFTLRVVEEMSVYSLKQLISKKVGIPVSSQFLLWDGIVLENNWRLKNECGLHDKSIIQLVYQPVHSFKIYISEPEVTNFEVTATSSVSILNVMYPEKCLIFDGKKLKSEGCLGDYAIQHGHLVQAVSRQGPVVIHIRAPDCTKLASVDVENETVLGLKARIWVEIPAMPPPSQQRLTYRGSPMEDNQILDEFGFEPSDSVVVSIPQRLVVRCHDGSIVDIDMHLTDKIIVLKRLICKKTAIDPNKQQLYYNGRLMDDEYTVERYTHSTKSMIQLCEFFYTDMHAQHIVSVVITIMVFLYFSGKSQCIDDPLQERVSSEGRRILWEQYGVEVTVPPGVIQEGTVTLRVYDSHSPCFEHHNYTPHSSVYELSLSSSEQVHSENVQVTLTKSRSNRCVISASRDPSKWTPDQLTPIFSFSELAGFQVGSRSRKEVSFTLKATGMYLCIAGQFI